MAGENDLEFETNQTREKERLISTLSFLFYFISFFFALWSTRNECVVLCQRLAHFIYIKLLRLRVYCARARIYLWVIARPWIRQGRYEFVFEWFITFSAVKTLSQPIFNFMLELHNSFWFVFRYLTCIITVTLNVSRLKLPPNSYRRLYFHILLSHLFKQCSHAL